VRSCVGAVRSTASMAEVPEERFLKRFPVFQSKVREVFIETVDSDIHNIHPLLQLQDPILPLLLHGVLHGGNPRSPPLSPVGVLIPSLFPELGGSIVSSQEVHRHLVVMSDVGRGVVQMLFHVIGRVCLKRRGEIEGGGGSIEQSGIGSISRHSGEDDLRGEVVVVLVGKEKRRWEEKTNNPLGYIQLTQ
jgi:hypothetical protein